MSKVEMLKDLQDHKFNLESSGIEPTNQLLDRFIRSFYDGYDTKTHGTQFGVVDSLRQLLRALEEY